MSLSKQLYIIISIIFFMIFTGNFIISVKNTKEYLETESITKAQDTATLLGMSLKNLLKDKTIYDLLVKKGFSNIIVISDDSGISVPVLNNAPGIYSARYAGINASDKDNNAKLISKLNELNLEKTPAFYTACIALIYKNEVYTVHGWMHGIVANKEVGENGFGYDPMFIPNGFDKTLGELPNEIKKEFSHRSKALKLAIKVLDVIL
jgi:XTP/dITP diphosphohydrolase